MEPTEVLAISDALGLFERVDFHLERIAQFGADGESTAAPFAQAK